MQRLFQGAEFCAFLCADLGLGPIQISRGAKGRQTPFGNP
jgi:hypothetical protein